MILSTKFYFYFIYKKSRIEIRLIFLYNIFMTYIMQDKLKHIFSNNDILLNSLKFCKKNNIGNSHLEYIKLSIDKFLACRDISKGFVKFKCPHCPVTHLFPITCKSRLCPSCGYRYSMTWTENIQRHILNVEHRHVLFTIPEECRKFFFYDRSLLSKLSAAVNQVFKFIFHNVSRKRKRKNKISEHSKYYFTDSDIVHYGLISVIHTFGRDLKWNPHVHAIVSLGGFNKNLEFRKMRYFNVDTIAGQWKYHVLKIIENGSYPSKKIEKVARLLRSFTRKTEGSSLTLAMVILTAQKALSNILDDTLHVPPLPNTRLLTLLTRRSLSFLTT